jgi:retron-type reverse transcriptase
MEKQPGNREESCMTCKPYDIPKILIWEAWLHVKANQGAAGIDAETIERFENKLGDNLYRLWNRMSSGSYFPPPVKAVPIPKKSGGVRILGIPTVADRVAQTAVKMWLEPQLDPIFRDDSYGYRPGEIGAGGDRRHQTSLLGLRLGCRVRHPGPVRQSRA